MADRGHVLIPRSALGERLQETAELKLQAEQLLGELEQAYTKEPVAKLGGWRHQPLRWRDQVLKLVHKR